MNTKFGYGDEKTWGKCAGHPNDPRTDVEWIANLEDEMASKIEEDLNSTHGLDVFREISSIIDYDKLDEIFLSIRLGKIDNDKAISDIKELMNVAEEKHVNNIVNEKLR